MHVLIFFIHDKLCMWWSATPLHSRLLESKPALLWSTWSVLPKPLTCSTTTKRTEDRKARRGTTDYVKEKKGNIYFLSKGPWVVLLWTHECRRSNTNNYIIQLSWVFSINAEKVNLESCTECRRHEYHKRHFIFYLNWFHIWLNTWSRLLQVLILVPVMEEVNVRGWE